MLWPPGLTISINCPVASILTLNTVAHTMGAAGVGAQYFRVFGNTGEAIYAGALTLAILVPTDMIPNILVYKISAHANHQRISRSDASLAGSPA